MDCRGISARHQRHSVKGWEGGRGKEKRDIRRKGTKGEKKSITRPDAHVEHRTSRLELGEEFFRLNRVMGVGPDSSRGGGEKEGKKNEMLLLCFWPSPGRLLLSLRLGR